MDITLEFIMLQDWLKLRVITNRQNRAVNGTDGENCSLTGMRLAREMAWQLRVLAAPADGPGLILSIYMVAHSCL